MSRTLICAIQIGTSRICAAAAWHDGKGNYEIVAMETEQALGCIRKGYVVDTEATATHIKSLVQKLSNRVKSNDCRGIDAAYIGINGISVHNMPHHPSITLSDGLSVNNEHLALLRQQSLAYNDEDQDIIGLETLGYTLDDIDCLNPVGRTGYQLTAHFQLIVCQHRLCAGVRAAMEKAGIRLSGIIATAQTVAHILSPDEKQRGCCLIDIGHSLTTVSVYANGALQHLATIPLGGNAVTQDIAKANDIKSEEAEKRKIDMEELDIVSRCRYEEIAANISHQIELSGYKGLLAAGCIMTGGAALQRGLTSLIGEQIGMKRIVARGYSGICFGISDRKPQFSSLTTMISQCTADCECKSEVKPVAPVAKPEPEPVIETKPAETPDTQKKVEKQVKNYPINRDERRSSIGTFLRDLFSGIDE